MRRLISIAAMALALGAVYAPASRAQGGTADAAVVPFSPLYQTLSVQWWRWVYSQPVHSNPLFDSTGDWAANGQSPTSGIFFIGGALGAILPDGSVSTPPFPVERTITISDRTHLFFPVLNTEWDNVGVAPPLSVTTLRALAADQVAHYTGMYATVDGKPVSGLDGDPLTVWNRTVSPVFRYTMPAADSLVLLFYGLDLTAVQPAVGDGAYLLLKPLSVGEHEITFGGVVDFLPAWQFVEQVTYHVRVVPSAD